MLSTALSAWLLLLAGTAGSAFAADDRPAPQEEVSQEKLRETLGKIPQKRAPLGDDEHVKGLLDTEALITSTLKDLGYQPTLHEFKWSNIFRDAKVDKDGKVVDQGTRYPITWNNVIVEIKGTEKPEEVFVLGAHFDAVYGSPGADDNATGTAALLEIARVLKDRPLKRTVRLCFFNLEEQVLVGSRAYFGSIVEKLVKKEEKIVGMASLEMLGYFSDEPGSQKSPQLPVDKSVFDPPTVGDFILIATVAKFQPFSRLMAKEMQAAAPELKIVPFDFVEITLPDIMRSDHAPFIMGNQPAVMVTDTSNFRNWANYHKPTDTIETLDMKRYTLVVKGVAGATFAIAQGADPEPGAAKPAPVKAPEGEDDD
jgi:hypothetical protein